MPFNIEAATPEMTELLSRCGNPNPHVAKAAQNQFVAELSAAYAMNRKEKLKVAKAALKTPLLEGVFKGDTLGNIFIETPIGRNDDATFPVGFKQDQIDEVIAVQSAMTGRIEERRIEGDEVRIDTFPVKNSVDTSLRFLTSARWDVMGGLWETMYQGFNVQRSDYGWQTLLGAGIARNLIVSDNLASVGVLSKRLINKMIISMRRNGGGNSSSVNRSKLTDVFISPELMGDIRNWSVLNGEIDNITQREIYIAPEGSDTVSTVFGVKLHALDELGVGQKYQLWYAANGGTLPNNGNQKVEVVIGLDLSKGDSFINPIRQGIEIFEDEAMHRSQRFGLYGWTEFGMGVKDVRRVILGAV